MYTRRGRRRPSTPRAGVTFSTRKKRFQSGPYAVYSGLHRFIDRVFWNKRDWPDRARIQRGAGDTHNGMKRGLKVHREIERWIKAGTSDKRRRMRLCATTKNILNVLILQMGCVPVRAEVTVACDVNKVATRIDVVCQRMDTKTFVVVEIKTGYGKQRFNGTHGRLKPRAFAALGQSHKVFAMLQAAVGAFLLKRTHPNTRICSAYVIRADSDNAESYKVPATLMSMVQNWMLRC